MDAIRRGDIWTVSLLAHPKPRPGLIVSIDAVNDLCPDVLILPITSHPGPVACALAPRFCAHRLPGREFRQVRIAGPRAQDSSQTPHWFRAASRLVECGGGDPAGAWDLRLTAARLAPAVPAPGLTGGAGVRSPRLA